MLSLLFMSFILRQYPEYQVWIKKKFLSWWGGGWIVSGHSILVVSKCGETTENDCPQALYISLVLLVLIAVYLLKIHQIVLYQLIVKLSIYKNISSSLPQFNWNTPYFDPKIDYRLPLKRTKIVFLQGRSNFWELYNKNDQGMYHFKGLWAPTNLAEKLLFGSCLQGGLRR